MKDMNIAKLTSIDLPLFNGIIQDLFPAVETPTIDYGKVACPVVFIWPHNGLIKQLKVCVYLCMNVCSDSQLLKAYILCVFLIIPILFFSEQLSHRLSLTETPFKRSIKACRYFPALSVHNSHNPLL